MKFTIKILTVFFLFLLPKVVTAQTYHQVTDTGGTQTVAGVNVTISHTGASCPRPTGICTTTTPYSYCISACGSAPTIRGAGSWSYSFSPHVNSIKADILAVNTDDTIRVMINGSQYYITSSNIFPACSATTTGITAVTGYMVGVNMGNSDVEFVANPGTSINTVEIDEYTTLTNNSGFSYYFYFAVDCPGSVTATATRDTLCTGDTLHLFTNTTLISNSATYSWAGPNGFSATSQNPVLNNISILGSGTYTVSVADTSSCVFNSSINIVVNSGPSITATSNSPICPGDTLFLFGTGPSGTTYQWTGPNSFSYTGQNPVITTFVIVDTGTYLLSGSLNGCTSSSATHVGLNAPGIPSVSYNNPLCPGDTLKLNASSSTSGVTYLWTGPNSFSSTLQNPFIPYAQAANSGIYSVTVSHGGCSSSASGTIVVSPLSGPPSLSISVSPNDTICAGDNITLTAISNNAGNAPTYQWKKNGINISGATSAVYTMGSLSNGDIITCKIIGNAPCQPVDTATSTGIHMHVVSLPPPSVSVTSYPANYAAGDTVTFTGHVPTGTTGLSYQWMKNGVIIPGANTVFYTSSNLSPGDSICLIVHSSVPCTFPDSVITCLRLTTGVNNINPGPASLNVYPNPNRGNFTISGRIQGSDQVTIEVINTLGQPIYVEAIQPEHHIFEKQLILGDIAPGVYTLLLKTENEYIINKITVKP